MNATDLHARVSALLLTFDGQADGSLDSSPTSAFRTLVDVRDFLATLPPEVSAEVPLELVSIEAHRAQQVEPNGVRIVPSGFVTIEARQMTELDALETEKFDATLAEHFRALRVTLYKRKQGAT